MYGFRDSSDIESVMMRKRDEFLLLCEMMCILLGVSAGISFNGFTFRSICRE